MNETESDREKWSRLRLLARLGAFLARPIAHLHASHLEAFGDARVRAIARSPGFGAPFERAVSRALGLDRFALSGDSEARLSESTDAKAALLVATAAPDELRTAAAMLSAAILHKRLSGLVTRADRDGAVARLGMAAFQVAIRESAALYGDLEALLPGSPPGPGLAGDALADADRPLAEPGNTWLYAFVSVAEPVLAPLYALRVPKGFALPSGIGRLDARRRAQIVALLRRKVPGWSACIA
jgi:hypothetical protein